MRSEKVIRRNRYARALCISLSLLTEHYSLGCCWSNWIVLSILARGSRCPAPAHATEGFDIREARGEADRGGILLLLPTYGTSCGCVKHRIACRNTSQQLDDLRDLPLLLISSSFAITWHDFCFTSL